MVAYCQFAPKKARVVQEKMWNDRCRRPNGGNPRGMEAEMRFMRICQRHLETGAFPGWVTEVTYSSQEEDGRGIDAVVYTRIDPIPIQIKSSILGCVRFLEQDQFWRIPCILVHETLSDDEIFGTIRDEISYVWEIRRITGGIAERAAV